MLDTHYIVYLPSTRTKAISLPPTGFDLKIIVLTNTGSKPFPELLYICSTEITLRCHNRAYFLYWLFLISATERSSNGLRLGFINTCFLYFPKYFCFAPNNELGSTEDFGAKEVFRLYCVVLYCIVLYCIVLYCIVLYCIVLYCIVLYCIVLYCIVLYCIVLYCIVLYCIVLYCIVLYCIVLYCIVLYCIVLYCIVLYCIVCIVSLTKLDDSTCR